MALRQGRLTPIIALWSWRTPCDQRPVRGAGILSMICAACRDQEKLGLDPRPRFGGVFELRESNSSADGYWGERWELYKVRSRDAPRRPLHCIPTVQRLLQWYEE